MAKLNKSGRGGKGNKAKKERPKKAKTTRAKKPDVSSQSGRKEKASRSFRAAGLTLAVLWIFIPLSARLAALSFDVPGQLEISGRQILLGFGLGFFQDIFVFLQILFLLWALGRLLPQWKAAKAFLLFSSFLVFLVINSYILFDGILYCNTGIRMDLSFFHFFGQAAFFVSSAKELGLWLFLSGVFLIIFLSFYAGRKTLKWLRPYIDRAKLPRDKWIVRLGTLCVVLCFVSPFLPYAVSYQCNNAVFDFEKTILSYPFEGRSNRSSFSNVPEDAQPKAVRAELVSPNYPLFKIVNDFYGEKQFEISIDHNQRPHVVFLFMESFRAANIGAIGRGRHFQSPHFDRLAKEGILFKNFYATGVQTTRAVISGLYGIVPRFTKKAVQSDSPDIRLYGIPDFFKRRGYRLGFFHNGPLKFERKDVFFAERGFDDIYGYKDMMRRFKNVKRHGWGIHDEFLAPFFVEWLKTHDKSGEPTFSVLFTVSHHHPWKTPPNNHVPTTMNLPDDKEYQDFLRTFHYSDYCLGKFCESLKKEGLSTKTIVFVLADTATPMGEHNNNHTLANHLYEESVHIPLLILADGRIREPRIIEDLASQVDLVPTVLDLFGFKDAYHSVGTSLVRKVNDRTVYFNNPFRAGFLGLRKGHLKCFVEVKTGRKVLFDLKDDPGESRNIGAQKIGTLQEFSKRIDDMTSFMTALYTNEAFVPKHWSAIPSRSAGLAEVPR